MSATAVPVGDIGVGAVDKLLDHGVGAGFDFIGGALPVDLAVFHKDDPVGDTEDASQFVRDDDVGDAVFFLEALDEFVDGVCGDGVEPGMRFIVADAGGVVNDGAGEGNSFFHTTGECGWHSFLLTGESDNFQNFGNLSVELVWIFDTVFDEREGNVLCNAHGVEEGTVLKHHP